MLASNEAMLSVFRRGDHDFEASLDGGAYQVRMLFS